MGLSPIEWIFLNELFLTNCQRRCSEGLVLRGPRSIHPMSKKPSQRTKKIIRFVLANHETLVAAGLRSFLQDLPGIQVLREIPLGAKTLSTVSRLRPDVLFIYLSTAEYEEVEIAARIAKKMPELAVIILSINTSVEYILQTLHAGIKGILSQRSSHDELQTALKSIFQGDVYLSPALPKAVLESCRNYFADSKPPVVQLTFRQKTILHYIAEGKNTKEIAEGLKVSSKTVEFHRARLMHRLGIRDVAGLVRYALRTGLVQL